MHVVIKFIKDKIDILDGLAMISAAILAMIIVNSGYSELYKVIINVPIIISISDWSINKPMLLWINDGLMAIFFLYVTLEIKREILEGSLSRPSQLILPSIAATGGVVFPSLVYISLNWNSADAMNGWAIPVATDIAFALAVVTLLKNYVPKSLRILLVSIAIIDDIAAISIIALFYTQNLSYLSLISGLISVFVLFIFNYYKVRTLSLYIIVGLLLWTFVLKSGVHATLAGVVLGALIPLNVKSGDNHSLLRKLERDLHPWVAFGVLPVFSFANAGVPLYNLTPDLLLEPMVQGIFFGLTVGAPFGVFVCSFVAVKLGIAKLPEKVNWLQYSGIAVLTGIGFTMSLFIGALAYDDIIYQDMIRLAVISGSIVSAIFGTSIIILSSRLKYAKM